MTKSVGSKELKSKRRRWREKQLEGLHGRAKDRIVRKGDGRYVEEEHDNGRAACFNMIWWPVCMMLLVHRVVSFSFCLWFLSRVRHSVYDERRGNDH